MTSGFMVTLTRCGGALLPVIGALTLAGNGWCGEPRLQPLPVEALTEQQTLLPSRPAVSPDGRWVASVVLTPDPQGADDGSGTIRGALRYSLHVIETSTGKVTRIGPTDREASSPVWSPDGTQLAFQADTDDQARMWIWSRTSGQARQLADVVPRQGSTVERWTPDGRYILAAVLPEGMTNETIKQRWGGTKSDSRYPLDERTTSGARVAVYRASAPDAGATPSKEPTQAASDTRQDYASNNLFYLADLALIEVATGRVQRLVSGFRPVDYRISPDGRYVSFAHSAGQEAGSGYRNLYDLLIVPTEGGAPRILAKGILNDAIRMEAVWSPDSRSLAFCDAGPATKNDCYVIGLDSAEARRVLVPARVPNERWRSLAPLWDANGHFLYLLGRSSLWQVRASELTAEPLPLPSGKQALDIVTRSDSGVAASSSGRSLIVHTSDWATKAMGFYAIDPGTRAVTKLREEAEYVSGFGIDVSADARTLVYVAQRVDASEQLWASDISFRSPRQLTDLNPQLRSYRMGKSRLVRWRSPQGSELQGAVLLPADYQRGRRYPLIVYVYGGNKLSGDLNVFGFHDHALMPYENMQLLATRGYAVLRPDTETRIGTPMRDIAESLMPAVDKLIDEGIADPERLGIMGRSYGGYSVLSVLVQTNRFKAAIEVCGQASLPGVFSEMTPDGTTWKISWAEEDQGKMGGTLWEYRERYIENSPLFYFDRVTTPLMIAHGTEDTAVAIHHGDEIFQALRRLGKEVEYAKYLGEPHVIVARANAIDYANRMIGWFDRHLQPRPVAMQ